MSFARSMVLAVLAAPCVLAQSAWLSFPDTPIKGESLSATHREWVDVIGFGIDGKLGGNGPGTFSVVKTLDSSSPGLQYHCARGQKIERAVLDMSRVGREGEVTLVRMELEDVVVTSYEISSRDERPVDKVGLAFGKVIFTYFPEGGAEKSVYFDHVKNVGGEGDEEEPPFDPDTDDDGMPDDWERANGLTVGVNDANGDSDGDGLRNIDELQLGTNPKSGTSFFKATLATGTEAGKFDLSWVSVAGKVYEVQWTADLLTPFTTIQEVTATGAEMTLPVTRSGSVGFYRVRPKP